MEKAHLRPAHPRPRIIPALRVRLRALRRVRLFHIRLRVRLLPLPVQSRLCRRFLAVPMVLSGVRAVLWRSVVSRTEFLRSKPRVLPIRDSAFRCSVRRGKPEQEVTRKLASVVQMIAGACSIARRMGAAGGCGRADRPRRPLRGAEVLQLRGPVPFLTVLFLLTLLWMREIQGGARFDFFCPPNSTYREGFR